MAAPESPDLCYRVRGLALLKYAGLFCLPLAALVSVPMAVALATGQTGMGLRYLAVVATLAAFGLAQRRLPDPGEAGVNEAQTLAAILFLGAPLLMILPLTGAGLGVTDALFEAVSGVTTTGLSCLASVEDAPDAFLFSRSWMQWYGGLGVVILSIGLLVRPGATAKSLAASENIENDLVGGTKAHARRIMIAYGGLTLASLVLVLATGTGFFDAVNYTLAAVSTGGFAPHDASLGALPGGMARGAVILACLAGSMPLVLFYRGYRRRGTDPFLKLQFYGVAGMGMAVSACLAWFMAMGSGWSLGGVYNAALLGFSAQTTAGFSSLDVAGLDNASKAALMFAMFAGGGVGSTAGGIKILRLLMIAKLVVSLVRRTCLPRHAVAGVGLAGRSVEQAELNQALVLFFLYVSALALTWVPFLAMGYPAVDSLFEVVSALGTVGLSTGISSPGLPDFLKGVLCADMLLGRLEIIPWLVLASPTTWFGGRR